MQEGDFYIVHSNLWYWVKLQLSNEMSGSGNRYIGMMVLVCEWGMINEI